MCKFKFRSYSRILSLIKFYDFKSGDDVRLTSIKVCDKPNEIDDSCVRQGCYLIRYFHYYKEYYYHKEFNQWYVLIQNIKHDHYILAEWNLFPHIDVKIYEKLSSLSLKYLSAEWQMNVRAYMLYKHNEILKRNSRKIRFKVIGR